MRRRRVLCIGLAALLVVPERVSAQQAPAKIPRVGILASGDNERAPMVDAFRAGLRDLGYVEGRNIILEFRFTRGDRSLGPKLAAELLALPVDVIVSEGVGPRSAVDPSGRVPIVSPVMMNPVELGSAASGLCRSHPEGSQTRRSADPGAGQIRFHRQSEDRARARPDDLAGDLRARRRSHRIAAAFRGMTVLFPPEAPQPVRGNGRCGA